MCCTPFDEPPTRCGRCSGHRIYFTWVQPGPLWYTIFRLCHANLSLTRLRSFWMQLERWPAAAAALAAALRRKYKGSLPKKQACDGSTVRGAGGRKVCAYLCLWHSGAECLPPRRSRSLQVVCLCNGAAMKLLRLIRQACGCSMVRGSDRLKERARLCL